MLSVFERAQAASLILRATGMDIVKTIELVQRLKRDNPEPLASMTVGQIVMLVAALAVTCKIDRQTFLQINAAAHELWSCIDEHAESSKRTEAAVDDLIESTLRGG